jgi:hypothetical protein
MGMARIHPQSLSLTTLGVAALRLLWQHLGRHALARQVLARILFRNHFSEAWSARRGKARLDLARQGMEF